MLLSESCSANLYTLGSGKRRGCFFSSSFKMRSRVLSNIDLVFNMTKQAIHACFSSGFSALNITFCWSRGHSSNEFLIPSLPSSSSLSMMLMSLMKYLSLYLSSPCTTDDPEPDMVLALGLLVLLKVHTINSPSQR